MRADSHTTIDHSIMRLSYHVGAVSHFATRGESVDRMPPRSHTLGARAWPCHTAVNTDSEMRVT